MSKFYTTQIQSPEGIIDEIIDSASHFNKDILAYALRTSNIDENKINTLTNDIIIRKANLEKEFYRLQDYSKNYNNKFLVDDNKCFSTALRLLRRLRSGIKCTKDIFVSFCPIKHDKIRRLELYRKNRPSAFAKSTLAYNTPYSRDLFYFESFPPCVRRIFEEMTSFFDVLINSMRLCKDVLDEEKWIRADSARCHELYEKAKNELLKECKNIIKIVNDEFIANMSKSNSLFLKRNKYAREEWFAQDTFHNGLKCDLHDFVLVEAYLNEKNMGLTNYEQSVWGTDVEKVYKIRYIISHFDEMTKATKKKTLNSKDIYLFAKRCKVKDDLQSFVVYFNSIYYQKNKSCKSVKAKAVYNARTTMLNNRTEEEEQVHFNNILDKFLSTMDKSSSSVIAV